MQGFRRLGLKFGIDLVVWMLATPLAFWIRLENQWLTFPDGMLLLVALSLPLKATAIYGYNLYRRSWHRLSLRDLLALGLAVVSVMAVLEAFVLFWPSALVLPRSIPLIDALLGLVALGGVRLGARLFFEERGRLSSSRPPRRVLIVGAGEAGTMIAREMLRHPRTRRTPVGFLDDDPVKQRQQFEGLRVLGSLDDLPRVTEKRHVDEVLIALPSQTGDVVRRVVTLAQKSGIDHRIIPGISELLSGRVSISQIREVDVEDLLRRDPVRLDLTEIASYLKDRVVLVTGAGGSIGSEIVRQVARFEPAAIVLMGRGEGSIYEIDCETRRQFPKVTAHAVIGDVCDAHAVEHMFSRFRPEVVFHAAAYKHVPLMESQPWEAVLNNVGGTYNLAELAMTAGVKRFVNVSTDKAVNPTSIMGATKRVAEMVVSAISTRSDRDAAFVSVRFGNVLGSRGSVIPRFKDQIHRGGPLTVTHPDMQRYFMTIPEASQLVLQAGGMATNGNLYVLDMGDPVNITDLARDLIMLSGLELGSDVEIVYSGIRPGEKLFEELLTAEEGTNASNHEKIFVARKNGLVEVDLHEQLERLFSAAREQDEPEIRRILTELIPSAQLGTTFEEASALLEEANHLQ